MRRVLSLSLVVVLSGCSFAQVRGLPPIEQREQPLRCNGHGPPITDTVLTTLFAAAALGLATDQTNDERFLAGAVAATPALLFGGSAIYGYAQVGSCRGVRDEWIEQHPEEAARAKAEAAARPKTLSPRERLTMIRKATPVAPARNLRFEFQGDYREAFDVAARAIASRGITLEQPLRDAGTAHTPWLYDNHAIRETGYRDAHGRMRLGIVASPVGVLTIQTSTEYCKRVFHGCSSTDQLTLVQEELLEELQVQIGGELQATMGTHAIPAAPAIPAAQGYPVVPTDGGGGAERRP